MTCPLTRRLLPWVAGFALLTATVTSCEKELDTQESAASPPAPAAPIPAVPVANGAIAPLSTMGGLALRTYDVPEASLPPLLSLLRTLLQGGDTQLGRVDVVPGNRLVVLAPESIQAGVATLLDEVAADAASVPPVATYEVDHWFVVGRPAAEVAIGGGLTDLGPALNAIASTQGPTAFALLEHLRLRSMDHEMAEIQGVYGGVRQMIAREQGQLVSEVNVDVAGSEWRTRLSIAPDQLVVLAQAGFRHPLPFDPFAADGLAGGTGGGSAEGARPDWEPGPETNLYHILRIRPEVRAEASP